jgi:hypothetical protein
MKGVHLALTSLLLFPPLATHASKQLVPAGSLINCTISQPRLSSKTAAVGDPVLCQASISSRNSSARLPFNSYLEGRFEDYKDPGHFVGKGWMELRFDRVVVGSRDVFPIDAKVVDVPGFNVDRDGRILGKGHRTRDIVKWSIPILWPIDLLTLPGRGPRPTLKSETRLTLLVMDDTEVPSINDHDPERDPSGLYHRQPSSYDDAPQEQPQPRVSQNEPPPQPMYQQPTYQQPTYQQQPAYQPAPQQYQQPVQQYQAPQMAYAAPMVMPVMPVYVAPQPVYVYSPPPVYMYTQPAVAMYSAPRMPTYPNTIASARPYSYGYGGYASPFGYGY